MKNVFLFLLCKSKSTNSMHGNPSSVFMAESPRRSLSIQSQDSSVSGRWSPGKSGSYMEYPLGKSRFHDHHIKPVPPMYVTEYEANYTWPATWTHKPKPPATAPPKSTGAVPPWETLEKVVDEISVADPLAASSKQQIHEHKLDANIEATYQYYKQKLGEESGEEKKEERRKHPQPAPPRPPTPEKMRLFCESVEALKRGEVVQK